MQTLKIEMAVAGSALFVLGVFVATRPTGAEASAVEPVAVREFTEADFAAFDRGFMLNGTPCPVGIELHGLCFAPSPVEGQFRKGDIAPANLPLVAAEFRIIVETDLKDPALRTVRFGQTLVLVDPVSREVIDTLHLAAPKSMSSAETPDAAG